MGLPEEKLIRRACSRARTVQVYAFGGQRAEIWWSQQASFLARLTNLAVWSLSAAQTTALARFAERAMKLSVTIQDGAALIACERGSVSVEPARRQAAA